MKPRRFAPAIVTIIFAAAAFLLLQSRQSAHAEPEPPARSTPRLTTEILTLAPFQRTHRFHGVVEPADHAKLAFTEGGRMLRRPVRVGDVVKKGAVVAQLDPGAFDNAVAASSASVDEVEARRRQLARDDRRVGRLYEQGAIADTEREQSSSGLERLEALQKAAKAQVRENQRRRSETVLHAPFAGVVTQVFAEPGEMLAPGQPVLMLAGHGGHEVTVEVPAAVARAVTSAMPVDVVVSGARSDDPLARAPLRGRVRAIAESAARERGLHPVVIDVEGGDVRAGAGVEVTWRETLSNGLSVPLSAIMNPSGRKPFVFRLEDGKAQRVWLRLGPLDGDRVRVLEGLQPGDRVIVSGSVHLLPGDRVEEVK